MESNVEKIVWQTEVSLFGRLNARVPQIPMWMTPTAVNRAEQLGLFLSPIHTDSDWKNYERIRGEIEIPFGVTEASEITEIVSNIKAITVKFNATWYFAQTSQYGTVGGIGLVEFQTEIGPIIRLLDVDILPRYQRQGFGNKLLKAVNELAYSKNIKLLCLKADADRWVKSWYLKFGFKELSVWNPGKNIDPYSVNS